MDMKGDGYGGFSDLNALGNPSKLFSIDTADGGVAGIGPIGNTRPTGIMADGINIDTSPTLFSDKALRKGMSTTKNESIKRSMSARK